MVFIRFMEGSLEGQTRDIPKRYIDVSINPPNYPLRMPKRDPFDIKTIKLEYELYDIKYRVNYTGQREVYYNSRGEAEAVLHEPREFD